MPTESEKISRAFNSFCIKQFSKEVKWFIPMPYYRAEDRNDEPHCPSCGETFRDTYPYCEHYMAEHKMEKKEADARAKERREKRKHGTVPTA